MEKKRIHCYYSGMVQGVGFRYRTMTAARQLGVDGWVKNLPDGRVELVAEGEERILTELTAAINKVMGPYIEDTQISWSAADNSSKGFVVKF